MRATPHPAFEDSLLTVIVLGLAVFGVMMIYSAGDLDVVSQATNAWRRQTLWLAVSIVGFWLALRVPIRWLEWAAPALYGGSLLLLVVVLGVPSEAGPRSWLRLGPLSLQPAELAKLAAVLVLARIAAARKTNPEHVWDLWPEIAVVAAPMLLVMAQPDLGTAIVFGIILLGALYWSGLPWTHLLLLLSPLVSLTLSLSTVAWATFFVLLVVFIYRVRPLLSETLAVLGANVAMGVALLPLWRGLEPYQQARILSFLRPETDPQGAGWHLIQSRVAIGSGGWVGKGFGDGTQKRLAFLPEQHTDFIFSVVGEELGFVGAALVLVAFGVLLWRVLAISERVPDAFASTIAFGIFSIWFAHLAQNVGMTVGLMPITGIPLPFLSYGGSFLLVSLLATAFLQRIVREDRTGG
ncbi:MAG: rod shape-determining protein RodA [Gemmatimonadota bacterium]